MLHRFIVVVCLLLWSVSVYSQMQAQAIDSLFLIAIQEQDSAAIQTYLSAGADVDVQDQQGATALMWAVYHDNLTLVQKLVAAGADIHKKGIIKGDGAAYYGNLLGLAVGRAGLPILTYLIETCEIPIEDRELDPDTGKEDGWTALQWALSAVKTDYVTYLLERGASTDQALHQLAEYYTNLGEYEPAMRYALAARSQAASQFGTDHIEYGIALNNLGFLYQKLGKYEHALSLYQKMAEIFANNLGETHHYYATALDHVGAIHRIMGDYEKALFYYEESKGIREKRFGKKDVEYVKSLNNLSVLYEAMGAYDKALPLYIEGLSSLEETIGKDHTYYGTLQNNLALVYRNIGVYDKSLALLEESLRNIEKARGKAHPSYGIRLNNIANIYRTQREYEKSIALYEETLRNKEQNQGSEHPGYASTLNNMGLAYKSLDSLDKAISLFRQAISIYEGPAGREYAAYGTSLGNLGQVYIQKGQYDQAESILEQALAHSKAYLGSQHPRYESHVSRLMNLHTERGNIEQAAHYARLRQENLSHQIQNRFHTLNDQTQYSYLRKLKPKFDLIQAFILAHHQEFPLTDLGYEQQLLLKSLLMVNQKSLLQALADHPDTSIQAQVDTWESLHRILSRQYLKPSQKRLASFDSLKQVAEHLEISLNQASATFREARQVLTWQDIQAQLEQGEAAIEFAHIPDDKNKVIYVAYIIRPEDSLPHLIRLCQEEALTQFLQTNNTLADAHLAYRSSRGIKPRRKKKRSAQASTASLYQLIWQPMDSLLDHTKRIYLSPSGLLHRLNLATIAIDTDQILADTYEIHLLGSTRSLVFQKNSPASQLQTASVWGGISYDVPDHSSPSPTSRSPQIWQALTGTAQELAQIGLILQSTGFDIHTHSADKATEEAFKDLDTMSMSPRILHVATHGYFFPKPSLYSVALNRGDSQMSSVQLSEHPMIRSGLILAGANQTWNGEPTLAGKEDGILTAYEISQLDLSGTELVVLSACETGLGDIDDSEGVYGLQRAFKIAGVKSIIMSLWQVPDQQTVELMEVFYQKWLVDSLPLRAAFAAAQEAMRQRYDDPYVWAGFVLME